MSVDTFVNLFRRISTGADVLEVILELLLIGFCINWCAGVLHGTRGTRLLRGLLILFVAATLLVKIVAAALEWTRLELLYRYFLFGLGFIALVAFQPELRRALIRAGDVRFMRRTSPRKKLIAALAEAAGYLSRNKFGALVAIQREIGLANWAENGTPLNADVSADLLKNIFFPNSPLHDLGVVVRDTRVIAAGCQFPVAESGEVDPSLGSRHRAAVGLSSESDALVMVVSEETGTISLADGGQLTRYLSLDDLEEELSERLTESPFARHRRGLRGLSDWWRVARRALVVVPLTLIIWFLADQASLIEAEGIELSLQVDHGPDWATTIVQPDRPEFRLAIRGPTRSVEALRGTAAAGPLQVTWRLPEVYDQSGQYELRGRALRNVVQSLAQFSERGVLVEKIVPDHLVFQVEAVREEMFPVRADPGLVRVANVQIEPAQVRAALPAGDLARVPPEERYLTVDLAGRLDDVAPGETRDFERVPVEKRMGAARVLRLTPPVVGVTLEVVAQQATKRLNVTVVLHENPQVQERVVFEVRDQNEWLIEIQVAGDRSRIETLTSEDVLAFVEVGSEQALPTTDYRPYDVTIVLPEGVRLVSAPPTVHMRVRTREAATP